MSEELKTVTKPHPRLLAVTVVCRFSRPQALQMSTPATSASNGAMLARTEKTAQLV